MKLISFDVGIKNMAYCIFDISGQLSITGWSVLNLLEEEPLTEICSQIIPGKTKKVLPKPCTKLAKYKKNGQCYCEKHTKNSTFIIPNKKNSMVSLKKLKVDELIKLGHSLFLFMDLVNLPKLKKDILDKLGEFYEKNSFELIVKKKTKNASEIDLITIGKNMKELLNASENFDELTHVVIENQISPIANRMKTIQGMLAQYFIMKNSDIHIDFVSSSNKLSQFGKGKQKTNVSSLTNTLITNPDYKQHKKDGLYYCNQILENNSCMTGWKDALKIKKADDLADCFLQGIWYLKNRNIITYADDLKIIFV
uniref:Mitochondrial resolvase Ydc2 catalytic domain-containing protein n=1 Tax=viral metagenome TaxID=1070528 RepID=A0A6C0LA67_9ZZZZ